MHMRSVATTLVSLRIAGGLVLALLCIPLLVPGSSPGEDWLFVGVQFDKVMVIDCQRDEVVDEIRLRHRIPVDMIVSPDKKYLYVVTHQKQSLEVIDIGKRRVMESIELSDGQRERRIFGLAAHPDGKRLYLHVKTTVRLLDEWTIEPPRIVVLDLTTKERRTLTEVPEGISRLVISRDGQRLYALGRDILTIDTVSEKVIDRRPLYTRLPDGSKLVDVFHIYGFEDQSGIYSVPYYAQAGDQPRFGLLLLDTVSKRLQFVNMGEPVLMFSTVVAPDHRYAYGVLHEVVKMDLVRQRIVKRTPHNRIHYTLNISSDGRKLYVAGAGPEVDVFDAQSLQLLTSIPLPGDVADAYLRLITLP